MVDLTKWEDHQLLNAVWVEDQCSGVPTGGLPMEDYLKELVRRNPDTKLFHSNLTVNERLLKLQN